jgi:pilus assembly protein Flp/PilA
MVLREWETEAMHSGEANMKNLFKKFLSNKSGATAIEYGLIAALIAVAVIGGVSQLGSSANSTFTTISDSM